MSHKGWVVRLEGPEQVAQAAWELQNSAERLAIVTQGHARHRSAMQQVAARTDTHREHADRTWELIRAAQRTWHTIGTTEDSSAEILSELRQLFARMQLDIGLIMALCGPRDSAPDPNLNLPNFMEASNAFLREAREALQHPR